MPIAIRVLISVVLFGGCALRVTGEWRVMPDNQDSVSHIVCIANSARRAALHNASMISSIVNSLPADLRITLVTSDPDAFSISPDPDPAARRIVDFVAVAGNPRLTMWVQDPFVVLTNDDGQISLLSSRRFGRSDDRVIAEPLADFLGVGHRTSQLEFDGGNIVAANDHVFIGANTIRRNGVRMGVRDDDVVRLFQRELGRQVIVIGPVPQSVGHIDMILSPAGGSRIVLADSGWGARLAEQALDEEPESIVGLKRAWEETWRRIEPGTPSDPDRPSHSNSNSIPNAEPNRFLRRTRNAIQASARLALELDATADELRNLGFIVYRMPFLAGPDQREKPPLTPPLRPRPPAPGFPWVTYNNVLLDFVPDRSGSTNVIEGAHGFLRSRSVAYVPAYGWAPIDDAARQAWEWIGFDVVPVRGLVASAIHGGSLRCCVKVLRRTRRIEVP